MKSTRKTKPSSTSTSNDDKEPRRVPSQERSRDKVRFILEATTEVLRAGGADRLHVKAVAKRAGVPEATLYQFFSSKSALLAAWEEHEIDEVTARVMARIMELMEARPPLEVAVREIVGMTVRGFKEMGILYGRPPLDGFFSRSQARFERRQRVTEMLASVLGRVGGVRPGKNLHAMATVALDATLTLAYALRDLSVDVCAEEVSDLVVRYIVADAT